MAMKPASAYVKPQHSHNYICVGAFYMGRSPKNRMPKAFLVFIELNDRGYSTGYFCREVWADMSHAHKTSDGDPEFRRVLTALEATDGVVGHENDINYKGFMLDLQEHIQEERRFIHLRASYDRNYKGKIACITEAHHIEPLPVKDLNVTFSPKVYARYHQYLDTIDYNLFLDAARKTETAAETIEQLLNINPEGTP